MYVTGKHPSPRFPWQPRIFTLLPQPRCCRQWHMSQGPSHSEARRQPVYLQGLDMYGIQQYKHNLDTTVVMGEVNQHWTKLQSHSLVGISVMQTLRLSNLVLFPQSGKYQVNPWPSDAILRHRTGSTFVQVMAWCLMAPSHYLNQCRLTISKVL